MLRVQKYIGFAVLALLVAIAAPAAQQALPDYQGPEAEAFLKNARITRTRGLSEGVTAPQQATLVRGDVTRFALLKTIDVERPGVATLSNGVVEVDFQDSWRTEVAAYEVDKIIGLGMVPATIEREHRGVRGSLQWWVESEWSESARRRDKIQPPDATAWNRQNLDMMLFDNLIYNNDRHLNNILVTKNFELRLIDHSRAFRTLAGLKDASMLTGFSRKLLAGLEKLDRETLRARTGRHLSANQISTMLTRRDQILALAKKLVAEKGESILY
jgi:hypothetical protein